MGYEINNSTERKAVKPMEITRDNAISTGRFLNRLEYHKTDTSEYLLIEVVDKSGAFARKHYFKPEIGRGFVKTAEDLKKEEEKIVGVVRSLTIAMLPDNYSTGNVDTFEQFVMKVISDIPKSMYSKELRVKCIYDKRKMYASLPPFGVVFEDPARVAETKMKIYNSDIVEPIKMAEDKPAVAPSMRPSKPFDDGVGFNVTDGDMPF